MQKSLVLQNDSSLEAEFREEFTASAALENELDDLEYKLTRIHNKAKALNEARIQKIKNYTAQYENSRNMLIKALNDNGYARFTETELDKAFANICNINNKAKS